VFKQAKTFHALDSEVTVIGSNVHSRQNIYSFICSLVPCSRTCLEAVVLLSHKGPVRLWKYNGENHGAEEEEEGKLGKE
jgi:hypothetical protein